MVLLIVQYALLWHARHVAETAAREGLDAARAYQAPTGAGPDAARSYLRDVAPTLLTAPEVTLTRTATTVRVRIRAGVLRVIPIGTFTVDESVQGPIERFVADGEGRPKAPEALPALAPDAWFGPLATREERALAWL